MYNYSSIYYLSYHLYGVHVARETVYLIQGDKPQSLHWEEYGFKAHFHQGATSPTDTCEFTVKTHMSGEFQFPEGTELVSAIYAVAFTHTLSDTVEIEIQHCVNLMNEEQGKHLSFVSTAKHDQLKFEFVKGGKFYPGKRYASIKGLHCTEIAIVERINPASGKESHQMTSNSVLL